MTQLDGNLRSGRLAIAQCQRLLEEGNLAQLMSFLRQSVREKLIEPSEHEQWRELALRAIMLSRMEALAGYSLREHLITDSEYFRVRFMIAGELGTISEVERAAMRRKFSTTSLTEDIGHALQLSKNREVLEAQLRDVDASTAIRAAYWGRYWDICENLSREHYAFDKWHWLQPDDLFVLIVATRKERNDVTECICEESLSAESDTILSKHPLVRLALCHYCLARGDTRLAITLANAFNCYVPGPRIWLRNYEAVVKAAGQPWQILAKVGRATSMSLELYAIAKVLDQTKRSG